MEKKSRDTSWNKSAEWYDDLVESKGSYQVELILPNMVRLLDIKKGMTLLDLACGQGFFSRIFADMGARVIGVDSAEALIQIAKAKKGSAIHYFVAPADKIPFVKDKSMDAVTIILSLQNIENIQGVLKESARVLKPEGRLLIVLNHPAFRIPKASSWGWDASAKALQVPVKELRNAHAMDSASSPRAKPTVEAFGVQYRRVDRYLSESRVEIIMHPGEKPREKTISFHRPLQVYAKALEKNGFMIARIEEWNSHRKSENGPCKDAEDRARKEFPLFLFIEARKLGD
jgi:ubiquinone/menaquinone biosynthesis C-methylase UbiE